MAGKYANETDADSQANTSVSQLNVLRFMI